MECCQFDTVGLFVNFEDDHLHDLMQLMHTFCDEHTINLNKCTVCINYYHWEYLSQYGFYKIMDNLKWLNSLSKRVLNFNTKENIIKEDAYNLVNYLYTKRSIAVFAGDPVDEINTYAYDLLVSDLKVPIVKLYQDIKTREIWVGEPDFDHTHPHKLN